MNRGGICSFDGHVHAHKQIGLLADGGFRVGLHLEGHFLRVLVDFSSLDRDRVRHAKNLGTSLTFKRQEMLQLGHHDGFFALLDRHERNGRGREVSWRSHDLLERRGIVNAATAGIRLAHNGEIPGARRRGGVRIELEDALILTFGDGLLTERADAVGLPDHEHADWLGEAFLTLGDDLEFQDAIIDERNGRFNDFQRIRGLFHHADGETIFHVRVVNNVAIAHDVEFLA